MKHRFNYDVEKESGQESGSNRSKHSRFRKKEGSILTIHDTMNYTSVNGVDSSYDDGVFNEEGNLYFYYSAVRDYDEVLNPNKDIKNLTIYPFYGVCGDFIQVGKGVTYLYDPRNFINLLGRSSYRSVVRENTSGSGNVRRTLLENSRVLISGTSA